MSPQVLQQGVDVLQLVLFNELEMFIEEHQLQGVLDDGEVEVGDGDALSAPASVLAEEEEEEDADARSSALDAALRAKVAWHSLNGMMMPTSAGYRSMFPFVGASEPEGGVSLSFGQLKKWALLAREVASSDDGLGQSLAAAAVSASSPRGGSRGGSP